MTRTDYSLLQQLGSFHPLSWSFLPPRPPTRKPHWPLWSQYRPRPWSTWGSWVPSGLPPDSWEAGGFWIHKDSTRYPGKTSRDVKGFGRTTNRSKIFLTNVLPFFGGYLTCEIQTTNSSTKKNIVTLLSVHMETLDTYLPKSDISWKSMNHILPLTVQNICDAKTHF